MAEKIQSQQLTTNVFRVSFPHLFKPHAPPNSKNDPKYSIDMLFSDPNDVKNIREACAKIMTQKFGADQKKWPKLKYNVIKNGDEKDGINGYAGHLYVTARSGDKPAVVDREKQEVLDQRKFYGGCYARAQISLFWYDTNGNKGIGVGLNAVQFVKDGESFGGGRVNVDKAFGDEIPDDGADDPSNYSDDEGGF